MFQKIQECCLQCFNCNKIKENYDYKKNEEPDLFTKEQFDKLLEEIVIINKKEEKEIMKLTNTQKEEESDYVLC